MARTQEQKERDRKVRKWVREHPGVVEEVARRRDALDSQSTAELASLAEIKFGIDVSKVRETLIAGIIAAEEKS